MEQQYSEQEKRNAKQLQVLKSWARSHPQEANQEGLATFSTGVVTPNFPAFDSTSQLWSDYIGPDLRHFLMRILYHKRKQQRFFLRIKNSTTYKLLSNLATQESPPRDINIKTMEEIESYIIVVVVWEAIHYEHYCRQTEDEGLSFYHPRLLHSSDQMLTEMVLSQHRVSSSSNASPRIPLGARCREQSRIMWAAVCSSAPHSQFDVGARLHLCIDN